MEEAYVLLVNLNLNDEDKWVHVFSLRYVCLKLERKFDKLMNILKTKIVILKL